MDQGALVSAKLEGGRRILEQLIAEGVDVVAAAWVKDAEEGRWRLYVCTPAVESGATREVYGLLRKAFAKVGESEISPFEVHLIGAKHSIAEHLLTIYEVRPTLKGHWVGGRRLGDISIDDCYIYPKPLPPVTGVLAMTTDEVLRKLTEFMSRSGIAQPVTVALRNSRTFQGIPYSLEKNKDVITLKFIETATGSIESIPAGDVASVS